MSYFLGWLALLEGMCVLAVAVGGVYPNKARGGQIIRAGIVAGAIFLGLFLLVVGYAALEGHGVFMAIEYKLFGPSSL